MKGLSFAKNAMKLAAGAKMFGKGSSSKPGRSTKRKRKTMRKGKRKFRKVRGRSIRIRGDDVHSGLASDWINITLNKPLKGKTQAKYMFFQNYAGKLTDAAGNQGATVMGHIASLSQLITTTSPQSAPATVNPDQIAQALFDLDPNQTNTGSNLINTSVAPPNQRIALYKCRVNYMFTNFGNFAQTLVLYVVTPKQNTNTNAAQSWIDGFTKGGFGQAARARAVAGSYGATKTGIPTYQDHYIRPVDSQLFNKQYKILKVHKIQLAAGATEEVNMHVKINKICKKDVLTENNISYVKGLNVQILAVWYGQPVVDKTTSAVVTTAATEIGYFGTFKYTCGSLKSTVPNPYDAFANNQISYGATAPNQNFINMLDAVANVIQA